VLDAMPLVDNNAAGDTAPCAGCTLRYAVHGLSTDGSPSRFDVWGSDAKIRSVVQLRSATTGKVLWSASFTAFTFDPFDAVAATGWVSLADRADHVFVRFGYGATGQILMRFDVHSTAVNTLGTGPVDPVQPNALFTTNEGAVAEDFDHDGVNEVAVQNWTLTNGVSHAEAGRTGEGVTVKYFRFENGGWTRFTPQVTTALLAEGAELSESDFHYFTAPDGSVVAPFATNGLQDGKADFYWKVTAGPHGLWLSASFLSLSQEGKNANCHPRDSTKVDRALAPGETVVVDMLCPFNPPAINVLSYAPFGTPLASWTDNYGGA